MNGDKHQDGLLPAVVDGFDELTARQVLRQLDFLSERELRALSRHETTHKKRRALLRAIDMRLQPRTH